MNFDTVVKNLTARGFSVKVFSTAAQAADYLDESIRGKTVGFGGSVTLEAMGMYERLQAHNTAVWHWRAETPEAAAQLRKKALTADVYLTSVNGLAETGELINIDGTGNRVAATLYGHKRVYFVVGSNKIAPDYDAALWRARNIASPKNAQRLGAKTPCAVKGDRCYNCQSPERICRALVVLWEKPKSAERMEIVLVDEPLGY